MARFGSLLLAWVGLLTGLVSSVADCEYGAFQQEVAALSIGILLFQGFKPLDINGPLQILFTLSRIRRIDVSFIAKEEGLVGSRPPNSPDGKTRFDKVVNMQMQATHSFANTPALDVLIVPGGKGTGALEQANDTSVEDFVRSRAGQTPHLLSVCTGAVSLQKAGVLDGLRATTNKLAWAWATSHGADKVHWVPSARWVNDVKVWTSSGVSAGIDMMYAFLQSLYGANDTVLIDAMNEIEYALHTSSDWDAFARVHKVPGADESVSLSDCVKPAGY